MTLPIHTVETVERMLASGCSQRQVARALEIARGTVLKIAQRKWRAKKHEDDSGIFPRGPAAVRCPECGAKAVPPCKACADRRGLAGRLPSPGLLLALIGEPLGLKLIREHRERYEPVRRWKERHPDRCFARARRRKAAPRLLPEPGYELFVALRNCIVRGLALPIWRSFKVRVDTWAHGEKRRQMAWYDEPLPVPRVPTGAPFGALTEEDFRKLIGYRGELSDAELDRLTIECGIDLAEVT